MPELNSGLSRRFPLAELRVCHTDPGQVISVGVHGVYGEAEGASAA